MPPPLRRGQNNLVKVGPVLIPDHAGLTNKHTETHRHAQTDVFITTPCPGRLAGRRNEQTAYIQVRGSRAQTNTQRHTYTQGRI